MKRTEKRLAALEVAVRYLPGVEVSEDDLYDTLASMGFRWLSDKKKWEKLEIDPAAPRSGKIALRLRCDLGDVDRAVELVIEALDSYGLVVTASAVYPDDRHGPAITGRVYLSGNLPPKKGG